MANSGYTLDQLRTLQGYYAKGILRVREADLSLDFTDGNDMKNRIDAIERELIACGELTNANVSRGIRTTRARITSGRTHQH